MVQEFQVLRCFSCQTFQVHQVKKSKKWNCKMCGEKQSLLKIYGQGSGADCRHHVQKLNLFHGEVLQAADMAFGLDCKEEITDNVPIEDEHEGTVEAQESDRYMSRWNKYLVENRENEYVRHAYSDGEKKSPLKIRRQKDMSLDDHGFHDQDSHCVRRKCSSDLSSQVKRLKTCEDRTTFISTENLQPQTETIVATISSLLPVSPQSGCVGSKWEKFLSSSVDAEENGEYSSMSQTLEENQASLALSWKKNECNNKVEEKFGESFTSNKTMIVPPVSKKHSAFGLCIQDEMPSCWKMAVCSAKPVDAPVTDRAKDPAFNSNVHTSVAHTIAHTNLFHTDEDFDDVY
ncbi:MRN complex-interacting protein [Pelobates fuscus]|uniref:MRN complex-interacting protein n=1 Tax=Pelobates fuscus TaxID=191477 RepID=UPI002FE4C626